MTSIPSSILIPMSANVIVGLVVERLKQRNLNGPACGRLFSAVPGGISRPCKPHSLKRLRIGGVLVVFIQ